MAAYNSRMKLSHLMVSGLVTAIAVVGAAGCKNKNADANTTTTAASVGSAAAAEPKAAANDDVPLDQFLAKSVPAACKTIATCKNDKVKVAATMPIMLIAGFGTIDKPELGNELKSAETSMKKDKRFVPNESECTTYGNVAMKVLGMQADALNAKVGKTIAYDSKKAAACLASIKKGPDACATEVKLAAEPKMNEIDAISKEVDPALDALTKPCDDVITGLVDAGGACDLDVECKGKGSKCKESHGHAKGANAKGAKPTKTCEASAGKH